MPIAVKLDSTTAKPYIRPHILTQSSISISMPALLEIACFGEPSAIVSASSGAQRLELCSDVSVGGLTPALSTFQSVSLHPALHSHRSVNRIPIHVMIRPRASDFIYSDSEYEKMEEELDVFREAGVDGFVFGILKPVEGEGSERTLAVDVERCRRLVERAGGRKCVFHRAFDELPQADMAHALELLIQCGFEGVLTSGGEPDAVTGRRILKDLVERAGDRIEVIVGGGVRSVNLELLRTETGAKFWHSSALVAGTQADVASSKEVETLRKILAK
jgi:copper homeostasis protein